MCAPKQLLNLKVQASFELTNMKQEPKLCKVRHYTLMDESRSGLSRWETPCQQFQIRYETKQWPIKDK